MSSFDNVVENWENNENVLAFQSLGDLDQPYSCEDWGNQATSGIPLIIDDTGLPVFGMFHTDNLLPSTVFIDHTMTVYYKEAGFSGEAAVNGIIQEMLDNLYGAPIIAANSEILINNEIDDDGVLNPGEGFSINFIFTNNSFETDALNAVATLSLDDGGNVMGEATLDLGDIALGQSVSGEYDVLLDEFVLFGDFNLLMTFTADYVNNFDELATYSKTVSISIGVSLNQAGFPIPTAELRSSPLIVDLDSDGDLEIIIGDNNGFIHIYNIDGTELVNGTFPFDTGNQIWGSAAAADLDDDGLIDFVIPSKSKHLYVFDLNGLKVDYNANKYLMGTPAIGNLDDDDDLEIVIGGYSSPSSSNQIFVINPDGSDVEGYPLILGEKVKAGIALADFNENGKDDIVVGTDDDHLYLIYDDGTIAQGFPFVGLDKFQAAPSIIDVQGEKIIFAGSNDNNFYAVNDDGTLRFSITTDNKVLSSPSFLEIDNEIYVFFGSNDDRIYAVDMLGNSLDGWPMDIVGSVQGSIVFSDLDGDNDPEIVAATDAGNIVAFHLDGSFVNYFPIANDFPFSGGVMIQDLDNDSDLELLAGSGSNLFVIDFKIQGDSSDYWNLYRGDVSRNGCRFYMINDEDCNVDLGDVTGDGNINILDLVQISNFIINDDIILSYYCAADFTGDGNVNILDLVQIANFIIAN